MNNANKMLLAFCGGVTANPVTLKFSVTQSPYFNLYLKLLENSEDIGYEDYASEYRSPFVISNWCYTISRLTMHV